jgi:glycosyltransferase involved in cell wall biosynthesis
MSMVASAAEAGPEGQGRKARFAFIVEQTFGQVAHTQNLESALARTDWIEATVTRLPFEPRHSIERLPGVRNWSLRASLMTRAALRRCLGHGPLDAAFVHTQVASLLSVGIMRAVPTVVSLDATPLNFDQVGSAYGHRRGGSLTETFKLVVNRRALLAASAVVSWSRLAADSLVADYGIPSTSVHVIAPGVDLRRLRPPDGPRPDGPVRVLFVGGDFVRKGGPDLLAAMRGIPDAELDVVTASDVQPPPGVRCRVHRGLKPGNAELLALYHRADVFALPSRGDCLPQALAEAAAAGLPLVATRTGAVPEIVRDGQNGFLVSVGTPPEIHLALRQLVASPELRTAMGRESHVLAQREHDALTNNRRIFQLMSDVANTSLVRPAAAGAR